MGAHRRGRRPRSCREGVGLTQVCRVQPDVPAIRRAFDYLVPDDLASSIAVGTVVRIPLHGRRVRGWVLDPDVEPDAVDAPAARLRSLLAVVSAGPPADVVALCEWAAWRWAGPIATFLRAASPANHVVDAPDGEDDHETAVYPPLLGPAHAWFGDALIVTAPDAHSHLAGAVRPLLASEGSSIVLVASANDAVTVAAMVRDDGRDVVELGFDTRAADATRAWQRARQGACVVVGGRTAVWAPVPDLATVIVIDEGDEAFDDERAPTWSGRDVAVERARRVGASVRMITPAPTVEAMEVLGEPASMPATARGWPRVEVVDVRDQEPGQSLLTRELADALRRAVDRGERAVCVLNRTGRARLLACRTCRELARCERCGATVGERDDALECSVCATTRPHVCLVCHGSKFRPVRPGVAGVRDDLAALLPRVDVASVEASTVDTPSAPVLVGTEAVLHRVSPTAASIGPIGVVAYLELDQELLAPRFRAAEQALWLLLRGARLLAPRSSARPGTLLVQTRLPEHAVVRAVVDAAPLDVTRAERPRREQLGFPPFGGLAAISGEPAAIEATCAALRTVPSVTVLGPVDDGKRALVRAPTWASLSDALAVPGVDAARAHGRLRIDVDPRRSA
ncbi:MAG: hypothetical protein ABWY77_01000 [Acidimicrobiia bacterium]